MEIKSPIAELHSIAHINPYGFKSFASGQTSTFYCSQCRVYGRIAPCIFVLILVEVLKDALHPNFQQVKIQIKADGTARKYVKGFNTWRKWASQFKEIVIFLASNVHV